MRLLHLSSLCLDGSTRSVILGLHLILVWATGLSGTSIEDRSKSIRSIDDINRKCIGITSLYKREAHFTRRLLGAAITCCRATSLFIVCQNLNTISIKCKSKFSTTYNQQRSLAFHGEILTVHRLGRTGHT